MKAILFLLLMLVMGGVADDSGTTTIAANLTCNGTIYAPCSGMPAFDPANNSTVEEWQISS